MPHALRYFLINQDGSTVFSYLLRYLDANPEKDSRPRSSGKIMRGNRATEEKVTVDAYSGYRGEEIPKKFILHGKKVEVVEILNAWIEQGTGYKAIKRYFEVKGSDGSAHKIHYDENKKGLVLRGRIKEVRMLFQ